MNSDQKTIYIYIFSKKLDKLNPQETKLNSLYKMNCNSLNKMVDLALMGLGNNYIKKTNKGKVKLLYFLKFKFFKVIETIS